MNFIQGLAWSSMGGYNRCRQATSRETNDLVKLFGPLSATVVIMLGWMAVRRARAPLEAVEAIRNLGTLLTLVTGVLSAVWWHQSATLDDKASVSQELDGQRRRSANILNGAAATTTGLALIGGVFSGLSWSSPEGALAGLAFLLLLAMSGSEIWLAADLSLRSGLSPRSALSIFILVLAAFLFIVHRILG
jgi:hypothetical protein